VVDIIGMKSYMGDGKTTADIPAELKEAAEKAHFALVEAAAEGEDELMEKYLENGSLTDAEMVRGLEDVVYAGNLSLCSARLADMKWARSPCSTTSLT
jgi:elongation factor G